MLGLGLRPQNVGLGLGLEGCGLSSWGCGFGGLEALALTTVIVKLLRTVAHVMAVK